MIEINFNGKKCRYFYPEKLLISEDGELALLPDRKTCLQIKTDSATNKKYVKNPWTGRNVLVEEAVIRCFCKPHPKDGDKYHVIHKDGKEDNCHCRNLAWRKAPYVHTTTPSTIFTVDGVKYTLCDNGSVLGLQTYDYYVDSSGKNVACIPYVKIPRKHSSDFWMAPIEQLMEQNGYVQGDKSVFKKPAIFHRNSDYLDCSSQHLEFGEEDETPYLAYQHKKRLAMIERNKKINP